MYKSLSLLSFKSSKNLISLRFKNNVYLEEIRSFSTQLQRVSILTEISDTPGSLNEILRYFWKHDISLTRIESKPIIKENNKMHIVINFDGQVGEIKTDSLLNDLYKKYDPSCITLLKEKKVPWFPTHISELDKLTQTVLYGGVDLVSDHPGFKDKNYCLRRKELAEIAKSYSTGSKIPFIQYHENETETWGIVYNKLKVLQKEYACREYLEIFDKMEKYCEYSDKAIPQAQNISDFLMSQTGFRLRPVAGLLSARDFLSGLAFRTFFSTQYIRHSSMPLYTPEPDICHEYIGHVPMFADPDFADFSQEIGLASLGASDEDIKKLAACYWFSVEFGLLYEQPLNYNTTTSNNNSSSNVIGNKSCLKAYGAGLLSSFGELEYSCCNNTTTTTIINNNTPNYVPWDPVIASNTEFPITSYQPTYFVANSLSDAKVKMINFCNENLSRPFNVKFDSCNNKIWVDRAIISQQP